MQPGAQVFGGLGQAEDVTGVQTGFELLCGKERMGGMAVPIASSLGLVHQDMNLLFAGRHPWKINRVPYFGN